VKKTALVTGISGQTGAYLARRLLQRGYQVIGTTRDVKGTDTWRLKRLQIDTEITLTSLDATSENQIHEALERYSPVEIYHLNGPSSVSQSFVDPTSYVPGILNQATGFLEALKKSQSNARFVNSASTDCFGNQPTVVLDEESPFAPISPYGIAKASTFWITKNYREAFGVNACSAILTNHESPLRGEEFVTHKIVKGVREIAEGKSSSLTLGNTKVGRDWLWADDVAHALELIGSSELAEEFVVASGKTSTLMDFVSLACAEAGLAVDEVVSIDPQLFRPADIEHIRLNPQKIMDTLGWKPRLSVEEIVHHLVHDTVA